MTWGLACVPPSGCTVSDSWRDSWIYPFPIQEKGLRMEAASCFRTPASLGYPQLNAAVLAKAGGLSGVLLGKL